MAPDRIEDETTFVPLFGVVSEVTEEAIELFLDRREAERVVENWDRDEPDQAGLLRVEVITLTGPEASIPRA